LRREERTFADFLTKEIGESHPFVNAKDLKRAATGSTDLELSLCGPDTFEGDASGDGLAIRVEHPFDEPVCDLLGAADLAYALVDGIGETFASDGMGAATLRIARLAW
jgi:hypothetical protein